MVLQHSDQRRRETKIMERVANICEVNLSLNFVSLGVILKWAADIDLESGIQQFDIYRNGALVGTVTGQKSNFHDAPQPAVPIFQFEFPALSRSDKITVTAVNHQNLESAGSREISLKQE